MKKENKEYRLTIRFTKKEIGQLKEYATSQNISVAELVRIRTFSKPLQVKRKNRIGRTNEEKQILYQLINMANDVNQLAKSSSTGFKASYQVSETLNKIDALIDKL